MKLSEIKSGVHVEREGEFSSIAEMSRWRNGALLPVTDLIQVEKLTKGKFSGCVITTRDLASKTPAGLGVLTSENPTESLYEIHNDLVRRSGFYQHIPANEIDESAVIHPTAVIAEKGVRISSGCVVGPKATIMENTTLGKGVVIGPGSVIGDEDTLIIRRGSSSEKVLSAGGVLVGEKVEIHSNCSISRAIFGGRTVIAAGTMIDNLVRIGQNAKIGERCFIVACASIGANVDMGEEIWIGPNSTISDGVTLGDRAYVTLGAVVVDDVGPDKKVSGNYAIDHEKFIEFLKKIR